VPAAPPRARKGPPAEGSSPGGPATFMAARRGSSSDGGLSPAKHGQVPALGTPPRRQRRRSSLLYGGAAEDRPKNLRRALRPRHAHFRSRAAPTWPIPTWACADGCEHGHGRPEAALQPRGPASPGLPPHADGTRQATPPCWRVLLLDQAGSPRLAAGSATKRKPGRVPETSASIQSLAGSRAARGRRPDRWRPWIP
jgi:hypothetical protein